MIREKFLWKKERKKKLLGKRSSSRYNPSGESIFANNEKSLGNAWIKDWMRSTASWLKTHPTSVLLVYPSTFNNLPSNFKSTPILTNDWCLLSWVATSAFEDI